MLRKPAATREVGCWWFVLVMNIHNPHHSLLSFSPMKKYQSVKYTISDIQKNHENNMLWTWRTSINDKLYDKLPLFLEKFLTPEENLLTWKRMTLSVRYSMMNDVANNFTHNSLQFSVDCNRLLCNLSTKTSKGHSYMKEFTWAL